MQICLYVYIYITIHTYIHIYIYTYKQMLPTNTKAEGPAGDREADAGDLSDQSLADPSGYFWGAEAACGRS